MAKTGRDPSQYFADLTAELGVPFYERIDVPATAPLKSALKSVTAERLNMKELAGDRVTATRTTAPGNNQSFGGIKVETEMGWFAARPSGTEDVCKVYAESFRDAAHLKAIQSDAQAAMARLV
jgi:phosphoglucomutase